MTAAVAALSLIALLFIVSLSAAPSLSAQSATATIAENFRGAPNGVLLGRLNQGTELRSARAQDRWVEGTIEGWIWAQSVQVAEEGAFDLVVSESAGENLRIAPQGAILAHLESGTLLEELERRSGWIRVRRTGWIWAASVELSAESESGGSGQPSPIPLSLDDWREAGDAGAAILANPDGDTLALTIAGSDLRVIGRDGNWARVRMEGWVWLPEEGGTNDGTVLTDVTSAEVSGEPETYKGRLVAWELRFVSLERARVVRTDFYDGEPFLLARPIDGDSSFVYIAVPPERLKEVEGLVPLERIRVVGRVRTGSSALTGSPILDLLELRRAGSRSR